MKLGNRANRDGLPFPKAANRAKLLEQTSSHANKAVEQGEAKFTIVSWPSTVQGTGRGDVWPLRGQPSHPTVQDEVVNCAGREPANDSDCTHVVAISL